MAGVTVSVELDEVHEAHDGVFGVVDIGLDREVDTGDRAVEYAFSYEDRAVEGRGWVGSGAGCGLEQRFL